MPFASLLYFLQTIFQTINLTIYNFEPCTPCKISIDQCSVGMEVETSMSVGLRFFDCSRFISNIILKENNETT